MKSTEPLSWHVYYSRDGRGKFLELESASTPSPTDISVALRNEFPPGELAIPDMSSGTTSDERAHAFFELNNIVVDAIESAPGGIAQYKDHQ